VDNIALGTGVIPYKGLASQLSKESASNLIWKKKSPRINKPQNFSAKILNQHDLRLLAAGLVESDDFAVLRSTQPERDQIEHCNCAGAVLGKIEKAEDSFVA
jgi:hypothetical protein